MKNSILMKSPAAWNGDMYREGAPTGNGKIGALVYGGIADEKILINHSELWSKGIQSNLPDVHESLSKTREYMDRGEYQLANWITTNALTEHGYEAELGMPTPLCDINIKQKNGGMFQGYKRIIHMDTGEVSVQWREGNTNYSRNLFVSREQDIVCYKIVSSMKSLEVDIWVDLHETYEKHGERKRKELEDGNALYSYSKDNYIGFYAKHDDDTYYGAIGRIETDGEIKSGQDGKLSIENASYIFLILKPFIGQEYSIANSGIQLFPHINENYDQLLKKHRQIHESLYGSVELELGDKLDSDLLSNEQLLEEAYDNVASPKLLEKLWKYSRYLMICGTHENGLPFPLYGLWHGRYIMPWPHNMANENVQMIYWHILPGGLFYATKSLIHYYVERMDIFKENATKIFGLPGIYLPAGTTPKQSMPNQVVPVITNWIGCAGWISQHFYDYYLYTKDEETLHKEIIPFMLEAALFYEHYLVKDKDGIYKIYPSVSPENTPKNLLPKEHEDMAHPCPSVINATMDVAIIKELMTNLVEISNTFHVFEDKKDIFVEIINHLPNYETTKEGDIKEWLYPGFKQRYDHRHLSHIYPLFPGREIVKERDEELIEGFELAVNKRVLGAQTGWSLAHMACIYARLKQPEAGLECLDILAKSCILKNFFTLHNDYRGMGLTLTKGNFAPIQLDAIMGCSEAIQEMLIYSGRDFLKLLPSLPDRLNKGKVTNLNFIGGSVNMEWDKNKNKFKAEIIANRDLKLQLYLPDFVKKDIINVQEGNYMINSGDYISIPNGSTMIIDVI
jgi:alpha-L-fucosidase 2